MVLNRTEKLLITNIALNLVFWASAFFFLLNR